MSIPAKIIDGASLVDASLTYVILNGEPVEISSVLANPSSNPEEPEEPDIEYGVLGIYDGGPNPTEDDIMVSRYGRYPDMSSTYYQPNQQNFNLQNEYTRINKGMSVLLTITSKNTLYMHDIANKTGAGWTWVQQYADRTQLVAEHAKLQGKKCYATLDHEFEVKQNQGMFASSITEQVYAKALSNYVEYCRANCPDVRTVWWYGAFDRTSINLVGSNITVMPDVIIFDPYAGSGANERFSDFADDINWLKTRSWFPANHPIGLGEFSTRQNDANAAQFFTNLRPQIAELGLEFAMFFAHSGTLNTIVLREDTTPLALAAFRESLAEGQD